MHLQTYLHLHPYMHLLPHLLPHLRLHKAKEDTSLTALKVTLTQVSYMEAPRGEAP